jgi:hypothetical protein
MTITYYCTQCDVAVSAEALTDDWPVCIYCGEPLASYARAMREREEAAERTEADWTTYHALTHDQKRAALAESDRHLARVFAQMRAESERMSATMANANAAMDRVVEQLQPVGLAVR